MNKKRKKVHAPTIFAMVVFVVSLIFFTNTAKPAQATTYNWYFSQDGCDEYAGSCGTYGDGSIGDPWKSLRKLEEQINSITNGTDTANAYLKRGDTWIFASDSDMIWVQKSNVTIDAYGTGAKPILDGNNTYPDGVVGSVPSAVPYNFAILVGAGASVDVANVSIKNLKIQNMYPGGGIEFTGADGNRAIGPGLVEYCDIDTVGWSGIMIYGVNNSDGSHAIKIEHNSVNAGCEFSRRNPTNFWPYVIGAFHDSGGHEYRYNYVHDSHGEGIGPDLSSIVEYNMISNTKSGNIYICGSSNMGQSIVRYNLVWGKSDGYNNNGLIRLDDEGQDGFNNNADIQIYGNVVVGGYAGIDLRNNPLDGSGWSSWGSVKVYNNTFIDNKYNIIAAYSDRFTHAEIKNNVSVINSDATSVCQHTSSWSSTSWVNWTIGPNFYYGDSVMSNSSLDAQFQHANNVFGTDAPLPKTSGWRNLTSLDDFSFADFYPAETSQLVNRAETDQISGYDQYLTTGTDWETLPDNEDFVLADQNTQGTDWDFGVIINQQSGGDVTPPSVPQGLSVE